LRQDNAEYIFGRLKEAEHIFNNMAKKTTRDEIWDAALSVLSDTETDEWFKASEA